MKSAKEEIEKADQDVFNFLNKLGPADTKEVPSDFMQSDNKVAPMVRFIVIE